MLAVDTNILVYAHRREAAEHSAATAVIRSLAEAAEPWGRGAYPGSRPCAWPSEDGSARLLCGQEANGLPRGIEGGLPPVRKGRGVGGLPCDKQVVRSEVMRRAAAAYLRRSRARRVSEAYRKAYRQADGLGEEWAGWEDEGAWPAR